MAVTVARFLLGKFGRDGPIFDRELPVIVDLCLGENEFGKCSSHDGAWRTG